MAKAKLIFDLDNRDDDMAHKRCIKSLDMAMLIWEFATNSRKTIESAIDENENIDADDAVELVYKRFWELCDEYVIDPDSLVE